MKKYWMALGSIILIACVILLYIFGKIIYHEDYTSLLNSENSIAKLIVNQSLSRYNNQSNAIVNLRDFVYINTVVGSGGFGSDNPIRHILKLKKREVKMLCDGMSYTYAYLLALYNIPRRIVVLANKKFVEGENRYDSHTSVEVWDSSRNKWIVSDPTFNASFRCEGSSELLNYNELHQCINKGNGKLIPVNNGINYISGRKVSDYYLPYSELLYAIKANSVPETNNAPGVDSFELPFVGWYEESVKKYHSPESVPAKY